MTLVLLVLLILLLVGGVGWRYNGGAPMGDPGNLILTVLFVILLVYLIRMLI